MHIKFQNVQAVDDKVIFQTSGKCCNYFNQRKITHRHHEVQLRFFHTALCIIATNTNAKFQVNQTGDDKVMLWTQNYSNKLLIQWQTICPFVKQSCPPYCHIDTGSGTVHLLISKELIGKYQHHFRKEHGHTPNQFHKL